VLPCLARHRLASSCQCIARTQLLPLTYSVRPRRPCCLPACVDGAQSKDAPTPTKVKQRGEWAGAEGVVAVSCGAEFSVALSAGGAVACWGHPQYRLRFIVITIR
jgi:hypothetical protein